MFSFFLYAQHWRCTFRFFKSHVFCFFFLMFACWWLKAQSPPLFLFLSVFKRGLKCSMQFQFCSSGRVNKGYCWQSSALRGRGGEGEGHPSLPGGLGWAGSCPMLTILPCTDLWISWHPETGNFRALFSSGALRHPQLGQPFGSAHLALAALNSGPRSSWSCSHGLSLSTSPLSSTTHL